MRCISCGEEYHSPAGDIVPVCSFCLVRHTPAEQRDYESRQSSEESSAEGNEPFGSLGTIFPEFQILEKVGEGGVGIVYKARQLALDRLVAIKVLNAAHMGDGEFKERFEREAKAMAMLNHPHIIGVHDFGERENWLYIVMEYVDGSDLGVRLQNREVDRIHALSITEQICEALHYAHGKGVIHRDIKPGNILIDDDGTAKVGDFGLARLVLDPQDFSLTMSNVGMGTIGYVAPEQADNAGKIDARADIYALGVLIYVMFNGHLPTGNFPAPTSKFPRPSRSLDEVVLKAMAATPENRCSAVCEILQVLRKEKNSQMRRKRNPAGSAGLGRRGIWGFALAGTLLLSVGVGWWMTTKDPGETVAKRTGTASPTPSDADQEEVPAEPQVDLLFPPRGLEGTSEFEKTRTRGGTLRRWSQMPYRIDISAAEQFDDLISVSELPFAAMGWYAARSNGEMVSSHPGYHLRHDYRQVSHGFSIEWPDQLVADPSGSRNRLPAIAPIERATGIAKQRDATFLLAPSGRVVTAADEAWRKSHHYLIEALAPLDDVIAIDAFASTFVAVRKSGLPLADVDNHGLFAPPDSAKPILQAEAGAFHVAGVTIDGEVVVWGHPDLVNRHPRLDACLSIPKGLSPTIRVTAFDFVIAAQHADGTWTAWGDDSDTGLIEQINSVGVALDFAFFTINRSSGAKCVWIEPTKSE